MKKNLLGLVAIVIALLALAAVLTNSSPKAAGVTAYDEVDATALKIGGSNGNRVGPIFASTCNLLGMDVSQAATSTKPYDCAVTGVVSGDVVLSVVLSTTSPNGGVANIGWFVRSAHASSTSGFVTVDISNFTGTAATPSVSAVGSSTQYLVVHPVTSVPGL